MPGDVLYTSPDGEGKNSYMAEVSHGRSSDSKCLLTWGDECACGLVLGTVSVAMCRCLLVGSRSLNAQEISFACISVLSRA